MATKKITLNELRSLVKQIIKEEYKGTDLNVLKSFPNYGGTIDEKNGSKTLYFNFKKTKLYINFKNNLVWGWGYSPKPVTLTAEEDEIVRKILDACVFYEDVYPEEI